MTIPELMSELGLARENSQYYYREYRAAKEAEEGLRAELDAKLRSEGLRSAKNDYYIASITSKPLIKITDERAAINWLERQPDIETDLYIGLKKTAFDGLVKAALKTDGEVVPGTELENNEYLTIKEVKKI